MKFLSLYKSVERNTPPAQEEMSRMGQLIEDGFKAGWLVATEGCLPSALGARVRRTGEKTTVTEVCNSSHQLEGGGHPTGQAVPPSRRRG